MKEVFYWEYNGGIRIQSNGINLSKYTRSNKFISAGYGYNQNQKVAIYDTDTMSAIKLIQNLTNDGFSVSKLEQ